jgi:hypothetical protein
MDSVVLPLPQTAHLSANPGQDMGGVMGLGGGAAGVGDGFAHDSDFTEHGRHFVGENRGYAMRLPRFFVTSFV